MVLQLMSKVEEKDILLAAKAFDTLDTVKKGYFSVEDMNQRVEEARKRAGSIMQTDEFRSPSPSPLTRIKKMISNEGDEPNSQRKRSSLPGMSSLRSSFTGAGKKPVASIQSQNSSGNTGSYAPPQATVDNPMKQSSLQPVVINKAPAPRGNVANVGFESISNDPQRKKSGVDTSAVVRDSML
jgi:hypothetical protein